MRSDYRFISGGFNSDFREKDLWAAVIARAVLDWQRLRTKYRRKMHNELKLFFESEDFRYICEIIDAEGLADKILRDVRSSDLWGLEVGDNEFICNICHQKKPDQEMWLDRKRFRYTYECKKCNKNQKQCT